MAVVLHDVAPPTWPLYKDFVARVDAMGAIPLTLLVVPDFHRSARVDTDPAFCEAMGRRLARGDELALHGYYHADPGPIPMRPRQYFMRRVYTCEGEFYDLSADVARQRLEAGLRLFHRLGWPVHGFVPPAWLLGKAARIVLDNPPFSYTSDPDALIRLPEHRPIPAPTLVWSSRSPWRRCLSRLWNDRRLRRHSDTALLRLGLHPADMQHAEARQYWLETLLTLLAEREPVTKRQWLDQIA